MERERAIWHQMIRRCHNPMTHEWAKYGGRGIAVCDAWRSDYRVFIADMGRRPSPQHSIDRIDNNKGYEPGNCRWATRIEQGRNRRDNRLVTIDGITKCATEWALDNGIPPKNVWRRVTKGWTIERAVTVAGDPRYVNKKKIDNETVNRIRLLFSQGLRVSEIARRVGGVDHSQVSNIVRGKTHVGEASK